MPTNVIFLDLDGVLCTLRSHLANGKRGGLMRDWDQTSCSFIKHICETYNLKIVISSSWRIHRASEVKKKLKQHKLFKYVYDKKNMFTPINGDRFRGNEIEDFLKKNKDIKKYIIIDDGLDFTVKQLKYNIKTSTDNGITAHNMLDCLDLIKKLKIS